MENTEKLELKILALREGFRSKISSVYDEHEQQIADLRIEITERARNEQSILEALNAANARVAELENERTPVVQEEAGAPDSSEDSDNSN